MWLGRVYVLPVFRCSDKLLLFLSWSVRVAFLGDSVL